MVTTRKLIVPALAVLALTTAGASWGHGFGGPGGPAGGPDGPGPRRGGPGSGLVERLIDPCGTACFETAHGCFKAADSAALSCGQQTCDPTIQTARTACAADRGSQACKDARKTLRDCVQPCVQTLRSALGSCHDTMGSCRDACETNQ